MNKEKLLDNFQKRDVLTISIQLADVNQTIDIPLLYRHCGNTVARVPESLNLQHATVKPHLFALVSDFLNQLVKAFRGPGGLKPKATAESRTLPLPPALLRLGLLWLLSQLGLYQQH